MSKLKIALGSVVESLTYMLMALMTMFSATFMKDIVSWWFAALFCLLVSGLMAYINYSGKVYGFGFGFDADEEEDSGEDKSC